MARGLASIKPHCCDKATTALAPKSYRSGGREQESNLPGTAWQPQPGLKSGRPTGTESPPLCSIRASRELGNEGCLVGLFQAAAIEHQSTLGQPSDHRAAQRSQKNNDFFQ